MRRRNHVLSSAEDRFAAKQAPRFVGPAKIIQVYSPVVYLMEDLDSKRRTKVFVDDLKKYTLSRGTQQLETQATAQNSTVAGDELVGRGVGASIGHRESRTTRPTLTTTPDAATSGQRTRSRESAAPSTTARVGRDILPPRRRGRPPKAPHLQGGRGGSGSPQHRRSQRRPERWPRTPPTPPLVVRYGFPEAEVRGTRTPSPPPMPHQIGRGRGRGCLFQLPLLPQLAPLQPVAEAEDGRGRPSSRAATRTDRCHASPSQRVRRM